MSWNMTEFKTRHNPYSMPPTIDLLYHNPFVQIASHSAQCLDLCFSHGTTDPGYLSMSTSID